MSTRATYRFHPSKHSLLSKPVVIYKHHDGYPEGAATWLYNAFRCEGRGLIEGFLAGNDGAELTDSHEAHGDTEYRYDIKPDETGSNWTVTVRTGYGEDWVPDAGHPSDLCEFISKRMNPDYVEDYSPLMRIKAQYGDGFRVMTKAKVDSEIQRNVMSLGHWTIAGPLELTHGNASSVRAEIALLKEAVFVEAAEKVTP